VFRTIRFFNGLKTLARATCLIGCGTLPLWSVSLQVSSETVPPGGVAQIKVFASKPTLIATGDISMDFDPKVFGDIQSIAVLSATGDQIGFANVKGRHLDAHFSSQYGGIGQLPGLPVFVVSIPVLASAAPGTKSSITLDPKYDTGVQRPSPGWTDPQGNVYGVTVSPGVFTVGGTVSVASVTPGGGLQPAGTVLEIRGTGFTASTRVAIDAVAIASVKVESAELIHVTLAGATEMTGKHAHVDGVDYFAALPSAPGPTPAGFNGIDGVYPIFPLATYTSVQLSSNATRPLYPYAFALQNPSATSVTVSIEAISSEQNGGLFTVLSSKSLTIPAGTSFLLDEFALESASDLFTSFWISSSIPIGVLTYAGYTGFIPPTVAAPVVNVPSSLQVKTSLGRSSVTITRQAGASPPPAEIVPVEGNLPFTVSVPEAAQSWLAVTPLSGTAYTTLQVTPKAGLAAGTYKTTVTVTAIPPSMLTPHTVIPATFDVLLTVTPTALLVGPGEFCCTFFAPGANAPITVSVVSNGDPFAFTASVSGGNWLSVSPTSGTTPAKLTLTANPAGLADGSYKSQLILKGPSNTVTVPVSLSISTPPPPPQPAIQYSPAALNFTLSSGSGPPATPQTITFHPNNIAYTVSGGPWLSTQYFTNDFQAIINVNASAVGLLAGVYHATITATSSNLPPVQIPVTLTVVAAPTSQTKVTVSPPSLTLTPAAPTQSFTVTSGGVPILVNLSVPPGQAVTPVTVDVSLNNATPGSYRQDVTVKWDTGSLTVPVTSEVPPNASSPPLISQIVNAASGLPGPLAAGEVFSIFGTGLGSANSGHTEVLIGDLGARVVYESFTQINAVVPQLPIRNGADVQLSNGVLAAPAGNLPISSSSPAIFTADSSGTGRGAILNQDGSANSAANPASRGSSILIFVNGGRPDSVTIGGIDTTPALVVSDGSVRATVPQGVSPGLAVPIWVTAAGIKSQTGVTVALQ
jgi:uncharacterized protein (TIGR03437 family)